MSEKLNPKDWTTFSKSKPFGYYPPEVDEEFQKYDDALSTLNKAYDDKEEENYKLKEKLVKYENELKDLHLQLATIDLPPMDEDVSKVVLKTFDDQGKGKSRTVDVKSKNQAPTEPKLGPIAKSVLNKPVQHDEKDASGYNLIQDGTMNSSKNGDTNLKAGFHIVS